MHKVQIPEHIVARVLKRQGRWNVHDDVPPQQTAFVVVDMQNYFMAPGQQVEIPAAREIVPNINRLAAALRGVGGLVVWIRTIANEDSFKNWSLFHDVLNTPQRRARRTEATLAMPSAATAPSAPSCGPASTFRRTISSCARRATVPLFKARPIWKRACASAPSPRCGLVARRRIHAAKARRVTRCC